MADRLATPIAVLLLAAMPALTGSAALAATLERHDDPVMGCTLRLSGVIEDGDAERLEALIAQRDAETLGEDHSGFWETYGSPITRRLCLDSSGGSWHEGVRLARVLGELNMGTAIAAGARCDGACPLVFMAGRYFHPEGEAASNNRVLHPEGQLGLEALQRVPANRSDSADAAELDHAMAIETIAGILELRLQQRYALADSLVLAMLRTPPGELLPLQTVGDAARWGIALAPVRWPEVPLATAIVNVCVNAEAAANDAAPDARDYWSAGDVARLLTFQPSEAFALSARFNEGFGREAMGPCQVDLVHGDQVTGSDLGQSTGPFGIYRIEAATGHEHTDNWYAFQAHAPDTPIDALPARDEDFSAILTRQIDQARQGTSDTDAFSCWLRAGAARVVNVNEYVNMRRQPGFPAPIVRRVPLGETLQLAGSGNARGFGSASQRQSCQNACQALDRDADDRAAGVRAQQCVDDHVIWYEVNDAQGNRGWISRRFLQQEG